MLWTVVPSAVGDLTLVSDGGALVAVFFDPAKDDLRRDFPLAKPGTDPVLAQAARELQAYFAGTQHGFDVPVRFAVGTPFQREVWTALQRIPYGQTWTYAQLAAVVGRPQAQRAVGAANGRNPLSVVVPCHRVIGASGALTGYGGGLDRKRTLLALEGALHASAAHA